jgi:two-component system NtrC family response regulator
VRPGDELFAPETIRVLESHAWPGNVRELANVIEHAAILCDDLPIFPRHLPSRFGQTKPRSLPFKTVAPQTLREIELDVIKQTLERHKGNKPKVAEELGISLKTLYNKLNQVSGQAEQPAA